MQKREEVEMLRKKYAGSQADRLSKAEDELKNIAKKLGETKF